MGWRTDLKQKISVPDQYFRGFFAEFLGTYILMVFGCGVNAQYTLGEGNFGGWIAIPMAWGMAVTMGVYASGGITGGCINPAVALAMAILGRVKPWWKFPIFWLAEYLGAFLGAASVYGVYSDALHDFEKKKGLTRSNSSSLSTASIFATFPKPFLSTQSAFGDQVLATALLMACILAITDKKNMETAKGLIPISVGFVVFTIGMAFGFNCGFAINPARDLAPRFFTFIAGWGGWVFTYQSNFAWVPVVGPHVGAILGAFLYQLTVGVHHPDNDDEYDLPRLPPNTIDAYELGPPNGKTNKSFKNDDGNMLY